MVGIDDFLELAVDVAGDVLGEVAKWNLPKKNSGAKSGISCANPAPPSGQSRMAPEPLVPEKLTPTPLRPEGIPEGTSTEGRKAPASTQNPPHPSYEAKPSTPAQCLLDISQRGLVGVILSSEILGPPMARRRGRHGWNSRY